MARKSTKKAAPKAAAKKTTAKKAAPKKAAAKKAAPKKVAAPIAPAPKKPQGGSIWLLSEGGETTLHFGTTSALETAAKLIESAPRIGASMGRSGVQSLSRIEGAHRAWSFRYVQDYRVTPA